MKKTILKVGAVALVLGVSAGALISASARAVALPAPQVTALEVSDSPFENPGTLDCQNQSFVCQKIVSVRLPVCDQE